MNRQPIYFTEGDAGGGTNAPLGAAIIEVKGDTTTGNDSWENVKKKVRQDLADLINSARRIQIGGRYAGGGVGGYGGGGPTTADSLKNDPATVAARQDAANARQLRRTLRQTFGGGVFTDSTGQIHTRGISGIDIGAAREQQRESNRIIREREIENRWRQRSARLERSHFDLSDRTIRTRRALELQNQLDETGRAEDQAGSEDTAMQKAWGGKSGRSGLGGLLGRNVNLTRYLGRIGGVYGIAKTVESLADVYTSVVEADRDIQAAHSSSERIQAILKGRQTYESAAREIPLIGPAFVSIRNAIDTFNGVGPQDIAREEEDTEYQRKFFQQAEDDQLAHAQRQQTIRETLDFTNSFATQKAAAKIAADAALKENTKKYGPEEERLSGLLTDTPKSSDMRLVPSVENPGMKFPNIRKINPETGGMDWTIVSQEEYDAAAGKYDQLNDQLQSIKGEHARANADATAQLDAINVQLEHQLEVEQTMLDASIQSSKDMIAHRPNQSAMDIKVAKALATIIKARPEEKAKVIQDQYLAMQADLAKFDLQTASAYATEAVPFRNVIGDPLHIRPIDDPRSVLVRGRDDLAYGVIQSYMDGYVGLIKNLGLAKAGR